MQLFSSSFTVDVATTSSAVQMELIDLQYSTDLKNTFGETDLAQFYRYSPVAKYPGLHENAIQMLPVFGSAYICEQYFSLIKTIKSETRSRLTQVHLTSTSRIPTTYLKVNLGDLVRRKPRCTVSTLANKLDGTSSLYHLLIILQKTITINTIEFQYGDFTLEKI